MVLKLVNATTKEALRSFLGMSLPPLFFSNCQILTWVIPDCSLLRGELTTQSQMSWLSTLQCLTWNYCFWHAQTFSVISHCKGLGLPCKCTCLHNFLALRTSEISHQTQHPCQDLQVKSWDWLFPLVISLPLKDLFSPFGFIFVLHASCDQLLFWI